MQIWGEGGRIKCLIDPKSLFKRGRAERERGLGLGLVYSELLMQGCPRKIQRVAVNIIKANLKTLHTFK